jgi:hypothetical protein
MPDKDATPIAEQIVEDLLNKLQKSEIYNEAIVKKLKEAASNGKLTSARTIIDAISLWEE